MWKLFGKQLPYLAGLILLNVTVQPIFAQDGPPIINPNRVNLIPVFPSTASQVENMIFVSPTGVDQVGAGTQAQPFHTITAALSTNPQPGTIIQLMPGVYSSQSGESFPLKLLPGVKLRGDGNSRGTNVAINGGGKFISPTFASQNIAILAAANSQIAGVTITNNNPRGYGLWIESSKNVSIANNTFTNTTHDGVFLTGDANALVSDNVFTKNTGSGISAVGSSTGDIRNNVFDNTGFGLSIGQQSKVVLVNNRIVNNVDGVIISNTASPAFRGNLISRNNRNGLVVLKDRDSQPTPNLGTQSDPGRNVIKDNREKDIINISGIAILAAGNEINRSRISGPIDYIAAVASTNSLIPKNSPIASNLPPKNFPSAIAPIINSPNTIDSNTIVIERDLPPVSSTRPNGNVISGNPVALAPMPVVRSNAINTNLRYRVVVPLDTTSSSQVKRIVPNAFMTRHNQQPAMQVGAYGDRTLADAQVRKLAQAGIKAQVAELIR